MISSPIQMWSIALVLLAQRRGFFYPHFTPFTLTIALLLVLTWPFLGKPSMMHETITRAPMASQKTAQIIPENIPAVSLSRLFTYFHACEVRHIRYKRGTKPAAWDLGHLPSMRYLDCSGFTQGAFAYATEGKLILSQGSVEQYEWFVRHGKRCNILDCGIDDDQLRICFHLPGHFERSGHVWLVYRRQTMECWGEHGVGSRFWNARTQSGYRLSGLCDACFILPES